MSRNPFDDMSERLGRLLPESAHELRADFERNAKTIMQQTLARMDLVTREEFDAQAEVLVRTRERLEAMQSRVAELERQAGIVPPAAESKHSKGADSADDSPADPE